VTAIAGRRRRSTLVASIAAAVAVVLVITLTIVGALALYNSTDGADASSERAELIFPSTPVGALAAVDSSSRSAAWPWTASVSSSGPRPPRGAPTSPARRRRRRRRS